MKDLLKGMLIGLLIMGAYYCGAYAERSAHPAEKAAYEAACINADIIRNALDNEYDAKEFKELVESWLPKNAEEFDKMNFTYLKNREDALGYCWCY